jgi:hypothetical protein
MADDCQRMNGSVRSPAPIVSVGVHGEYQNPLAATIVSVSVYELEKKKGRLR